MKQLTLEFPNDPKWETLDYKNEWVPSIWNEDTWYYQDKFGITQDDPYQRNKHIGTMLPQLKTKLCQTATHNQTS